MTTINAVKKDKKEFEKQLRKPTGANGLAVANFLKKYNKQPILWTLSHLTVQPNDTVLEIGYGTGDALKLIAEKLTTGRVFGIDFSQTMFEESMKTNKQEAEAGKVIPEYGDIRDKSYPECFFNKIVAINVLYFWENPVSILRKIYKSLVPGGRVVLFFYHKNDQQDREEHGIFKNYTSEEVVDLFEKSGFEQCYFFEEMLKGSDRLAVCAVGKKRS